MNYIYIIRSKDERLKEMCYIGSTNNVNKRISIHKSKSLMYPDRKLYKFILNHGGFENFRFDILEITDDGRRRERYYIDKFQPTLNSNRINLTLEEKVLNKKICKRNYQINNKEKYNAYMREYMRQKRQNTLY
jgi:hypothetical protein